MPEMGATSLRVVVSVAALAFALENDIVTPPFSREGDFGAQFESAAQ